MSDQHLYMEVSCSVSNGEWIKFVGAPLMELLGMPVSLHRSTCVSRYGNSSLLIMHIVHTLEGNRLCLSSLLETEIEFPTSAFCLARPHPAQPRVQCISQGVNQQRGACFYSPLSCQWTQKVNFMKTQDLKFAFSRSILLKIFKFLQSSKLKNV